MKNLLPSRWRMMRALLAPAMAAVAVAVLLAGVPAKAQEADADAVDPNAVVATVNGEPITESDLVAAAEDFGQDLLQLPADQQRAALIDAVIDMKLMAAQATERGLDQDPTFLMRMEQLRERELRNIYFGQVIDAMISQEEVRARYDQEIAALELPEEYRASHILVETEAEAIEIIRLLNEGGDFAELATARSLDTASAQRGGDLGFYGPGELVPEFEQAALALEIGTYTQVAIQSEFGWHVIRLEERRTQPPPPFEAVASQVRLILLREVYLETLGALREQSEIEIVGGVSEEPIVPVPDDPAVPLPLDPALPAPGQ